MSGGAVYDFISGRRHKISRQTESQEDCCPRCSLPNRDGAFFCGSCGTQLSSLNTVVWWKRRWRSFARLMLFLLPTVTLALFILPYASLIAGNLLFYFGQTDGAITLYSFACSLNSQSATGHYDLAVALHKKGNLDDAVYYYRRAIRFSGGSDPEFYNGLGLALQAKGDIVGAEGAFREALRLEPG